MLSLVINSLSLNIPTLSPTLIIGNFSDRNCWCKDYSDLVHEFIDGIDSPLFDLIQMINVFKNRVWLHFCTCVDVRVFIFSVCVNSDKLPTDRGKLVMEHIFKLQEFCNSMVKLCLDGYEYAYLKAIVLFSPGM